jgi:hypothetical protein
MVSKESGRMICYMQRKGLDEYGSLMTLASGLVKSKLHLLAGQKVRWYAGSTEPASDYTIDFPRLSL